MAKQHIYTQTEKDWLRDNVVGNSYKEVTEGFNEAFGLQLKQTQISGSIKRYGLCNGRDCRFKKSHVSFNKGKKGVGGWAPTNFKKGHVPWNYKPVGSERINTDGYAAVKVADPKKWREKHAVIWESINGPIPKGHVVVFGDGNKQNFSPDNLILISRRQLAVVNKHGLIYNSAELTKIGLKIADIKIKIGDRKRNEKRGKRNAD